MRRLGCPALVDDIYQSVAEKILRRRSQQLDNPKAYLFRSASNAINDHYRQNLTHENYVSQAQSRTDLHIDTKSPEQTATATQAVKIVEKAIAELPLLTQKIFYLYRLEGLTHQAISEQLDISRSTVERRLSKAISHWQKRLHQASIHRHNYDD